MTLRRGIAILGMSILVTAVGIAVLINVAPTTVIVGGAAAVVAALVTLRAPRVGVAIWLITVCLMPHWLGIEVGGIYLPPVTLVTAVLAIPVFRHLPKMHALDLLIVAAVACGVLVQVFGDGNRAILAAAVVQWLPAYFVARSLGTQAGSGWTLKAFAYVMLAVAVLALIEFQFGARLFDMLNGPDLGQNRWALVLSRAGFPRSEATLGHPIALGGALCLALPALLLSDVRHSTKVFGVLVLGAATAATISRGPMAAFVVTLLLCAWASRRLRIGPRVVILGGIVLATVTVAVPRVKGLSETDSTIEVSTAYRETVLLDLIRQLHPFGFADGIVEVNGNILFQGYASLDNAFLAIAAPFGWVMPTLLVAPVAIAAWRSFVRRTASAAEVALVGQLPVLLTVALIVQYGALVWFFAGLAVVAAQEARMGTAESDDRALETAAYRTS